MERVASIRLQKIQIIYKKALLTNKILYYYNKN